MKKKAPALSELDKNRNLTVLRLLLHVPEFQKDVAKLRKELGIPERGFGWHSFGLSQWSSKRRLVHYSRGEGQEKGDEFYLREDTVRANFPANFYEEHMSKLGTKYGLPFNFYAYPYIGLPRFALTNELISPRYNFTIASTGGNGVHQWTSIIMYAPLTKAETQNALNLRRMQADFLRNHFKGFNKFSRQRTRLNLKRDLILLDEQIQRPSKPKKVKKYAPDDYLDLYTKNKSNKISSKKLKELERMYKGEISVDFDSPTSRQIGKKHRVSGDTTRQAKKRLNSLAKELFGYDLEP